MKNKPMRTSSKCANSIIFVMCCMYYLPNSSSNGSKVAWWKLLIKGHSKVKHSLSLILSWQPEPHTSICFSQQKELSLQQILCRMPWCKYSHNDFCSLKASTYNKRPFNYLIGHFSIMFYFNISCQFCIHSIKFL